MLRTLVRRASRAAVPATVGVILVLGAASPAQGEDVGDGYLDCNGGEICLIMMDVCNTSTINCSNPKGAVYLTYQKHFWWSQSHASYEWTDVYTGDKTSWTVRNSASAIRNRDTQCSVKVIDDRGPIPDDVQYILQGLGHSYFDLQSHVDDQNDRHERYSC